jgi:hypothetical protein
MYENSHGLFFCADKFDIASGISSDRYVPFELEYCEQNFISLSVPLLDNDLPVLEAVNNLCIDKGIYVGSA